MRGSTTIYRSRPTPTRATTRCSCRPATSTKRSSPRSSAATRPPTPTSNGSAFEKIDSFRTGVLGGLSACQGRHRAVTAAGAGPTTLAALDLGTNSFHLVVARLLENGFEVVTREKETVRLGHGGGDMKETVRRRDRPRHRVAAADAAHRRLARRLAARRCHERRPRGAERRRVPHAGAARGQGRHRGDLRSRRGPPDPPRRVAGRARVRSAASCWSTSVAARPRCWSASAARRWRPQLQARRGPPDRPVLPRRDDVMPAPSASAGRTSARSSQRSNERSKSSASTSPSCRRARPRRSLEWSMPRATTPRCTPSTASSSASTNCRPSPKDWRRRRQWTTAGRRPASIRRAPTSSSPGRWCSKVLPTSTASRASCSARPRCARACCSTPSPGFQGGALHHLRDVSRRSIKRAGRTMRRRPHPLDARRRVGVAAVRRDRDVARPAARRP